MCLKNLLQTLSSALSPGPHIVLTDLLCHGHNFPPENKILIKSLPSGLSGCWAGLVVLALGQCLWVTCELVTPALCLSSLAVLPTHLQTEKTLNFPPGNSTNRHRSTPCTTGTQTTFLVCGNDEELPVQGWRGTRTSAEFWLMPRAGAWLTWPWLMTSCVCLSHTALCLTSLGCWG